MTDENLRWKIEQLVAIEEIKKLKARFFRFVDTKQWDAFARLFTDDAELFYPEYFDEPRSIAESVATNKNVLATGVSIHKGYMPEIEITGPLTATGVWGMTDHLWMEPGNFTNSSELFGSGHYFETYEKHGDTWLIKTLKLARLRTLTVSLPKRVGY